MKAALDWVLLRGAFAAAKERAKAVSSETRAAQARAHAAFTAADQVWFGADGPSPEGRRRAAMALYRDALVEALGASGREAPALGEIGFSEAEIEAAKGWAEAKGVPDDATVEARERLRGLAMRVLADLDAPDTELERLTALRLGRSLAAGVGLLLVAWLGWRAVDRVVYGSDLAKGAPWRTSSTALTCAPAEHLCADTVTDIFFVTRDEESPFIEYDLGASKRVSRVEVKNRADCCADRAVPLVVEVSEDQKTWREVARRTSVFSTWTASFAATQARWVRVRVTRKSTLHLEQVVIR